MLASLYSNNLVFLPQQRVYGSIHSLYRHACNLDFPDGLITLLTAGRSVQPSCIVIQDCHNFTPLQNMQSGTVSLFGQKLLLKDDDTEIEIDLRAAQEVNVSLIPHTESTLPRQLAEQMEALLTELFQYEEAGYGLTPVLSAVFPHLSNKGLEQNIWSRFLSERLVQLKTALLAKDIDLCRHLGPQLLGCGPGLTPSSDDFLVGIFAAIQKAGPCFVPGRAQEFCRALAEQAEKKTGRISTHYLHLATAGYFGQDLLQLLDHCYAQSPLFSDYIEKVADYGSSSGLDMLSGLYFGTMIVLQQKGIVPK